MIDRDALTSYLGGVLRGPIEVLTLRPFKDAPAEAEDALVIAHPRWYPTLTAGTRRALIGFAQRLMANDPVDPALVLELLGGRS